MTRAPALGPCEPCGGSGGDGPEECEACGGDGYVPEAGLDPGPHDAPAECGGLMSAEADLAAALEIARDDLDAALMYAQAADATVQARQERIAELETGLLRIVGLIPDVAEGDTLGGLLDQVYAIAHDILERRAAGGEG